MRPAASGGRRREADDCRRRPRSCAAGRWSGFSPAPAPAVPSGRRRAPCLRLANAISAPGLRRCSTTGRSTHDYQEPRGHTQPSASANSRDGPVGRRSARPPATGVRALRGPVSGRRHRQRAQPLAQLPLAGQEGGAGFDNARHGCRRRRVCLAQRPRRAPNRQSRSASVAGHARFLTLLSVRLIFEATAGASRRVSCLSAGHRPRAGHKLHRQEGRPRCSRERTVPTAQPMPPRPRRRSSPANRRARSPRDTDGQRQHGRAQRLDTLRSRQIPKRVDVDHQKLVHAIVVLARVASPSGCSSRSRSARRRTWFRAIPHSHAATEAGRRRSVRRRSSPRETHPV